MSDKEPKGVRCRNCGRSIDVNLEITTYGMQYADINSEERVCSDKCRYEVLMKGKHIPIAVAEDIAKQYNYDQVVILARKIGAGGNSHATTYGRNREHCEVAGHIGKVFLDLEDGKCNVVYKDE